jgi:hypothetical protein
MKRFIARFALAAVILGAGGPAHCAQGVDMDLVDNPRSIVITDPLAERRWTELFSSDPNHMRRQITELVQREPKQALTLLAARLLYVGDPWERREDENHSLGQWRRNSAVVNRAILRELRLRWPKNKAMLPIYARFIKQESDPELVLSTLVNVLRLDGDQAKAFALLAADATVEGALPSAQNSAARQLGTAFLVENFGIEAPESQRALNCALLRATGIERAKAIMLVDRGELPELLELATLRMLAENKQRAITGEDQVSLMLLCARIQGVRNSDLAVGLTDLVMTSPRALASAACTALSTGVPFEVNLPLTDMAHYAGVVTDLALRHAILELLLRLNPALVEKVAGADSPWTALSAHRNQLSTWEWEGN